MTSPLSSGAPTPSPKAKRPSTLSEVSASPQVTETICLGSRIPEALQAALDRSTSPNRLALRPSLSASTEEPFSAPGPFQSLKPHALGSHDMLVRTAGGAVHRIRPSIDRLEPSPSHATLLQQQKAIIERFSKNRHLVAPCSPEQSSSTLHAALGLLPRWGDIERTVTELEPTESHEFLKDTYSAVFELSRLIELSSLTVPLGLQLHRGSDFSSEASADHLAPFATNDPSKLEGKSQHIAVPTEPAPHPPNRPPQPFQRQSTIALSFPQFTMVERLPVGNEQLGSGGPGLITFMESDTSLASASRAAFEESNVDKSKSAADIAGFKNVNHYTLLEEIGRGMFGKVYLAANAADGSAVAIKVMDCNVKVPKHRFGQATAKAALARSVGLSAPPPVDDSNSLVLREIAIMKRLNHKNIVMLKEVIHDEEEELVYMVMQYVDNGPIAKVNEDGTCGRLTVEQVRSFLRQAATGLQYLHNHGIIHRDIKPENILHSSEGVCCLADFGVSAVVREGQNTVDFAAGTQTFFSPEMCRGRAEEVQRFAKESDIWALGVTFYAVRFGRLPFFSTNVLDLCDKIQNSPLTFPDDECPADDPLRELLSRMLAKDPKDRIPLAALRKHPCLGEGHALKSEESEATLLYEPPTGFEETVIRKASGKSVFTGGGRSCASRSSITAPFHGLDSCSTSSQPSPPHPRGAASPAHLSLDRDEWLVSESEWTALPRGPIEMLKFRKIAMGDQKGDAESAEVTVVTQPKPNGGKSS